MHNLQQALSHRLIALLDLIIYGNLLIGFGAFSMSQFYIEIMGTKSSTSTSLSLFLFAATLFTYNFHRRLGFAISPAAYPSESVKWMNEHPITSRLLGLVSFVLAIYFFVDLPRSTLWVILPISLLSLFYIQGLSEGMNLRRIPLLKLFIISITWSAAAILLPAQDMLIDNNRLLLFLAAFFYMIAEIIPFDIRDLESDQLDELKTLPGVLNIKRSKFIAILALLLSNLILIPLLILDEDWIHLLAYLSSSIFLLICLLQVREGKADKYYSLLIELSLIFPYLLSILFRQLW